MKVEAEIFKRRFESVTQLADEYAHSDASGAEEVAMLLRRAVKLMLAIQRSEPFVVTPLPDPNADAVSDVRAG